MNAKIKITAGILFLTEAIFFGIFFLKDANFQLLNPQGPIASQQKALIITAVILMLIIVAPVYVATFIIAYKYRSGNKKSKYNPRLKHNKFIELSWWIVPSLIIAILAVVTWKNTHTLDPYKPLESTVAPITIQVVSLQWKWLFIYPEQNIATVNFIQFPEKTPISFELTSDAPMNSFWIPSLAGQIYTMTGMSTKHHMMANTIGDFNGSAAEISGRGFAGMRFVARSSSGQDFNTWVQEVRKSPDVLNMAEYQKLALPSEYVPVAYYRSVEENLYNKIIMKFGDMPVKSAGSEHHQGM